MVDGHTATTPDGARGLSLGLGEIEEEAVAAVAVGANAVGSPLAMSPEDTEDAVGPLRRRMRALEELKIRLARRSTRRISYRDFVMMLSGASAFVSDAAAAAARIPARMSESVSETMIPMQRRLSERMSSVGSTLNLMGLTRAGSPLPSPVRTKHQTLAGGVRFASSSNTVAPCPPTSGAAGGDDGGGVGASPTSGGMRTTRSLDALREKDGGGDARDGGVCVGALATGGGGSPGHASGHALARPRSQGSISGEDEGGRAWFQPPTEMSSRGEGSSRGSVGNRGGSGGSSGDGGGGGGRPPRHLSVAVPGVSSPGAPVATLALRREVLAPLSHRPAVPDPQTPPA